MSIVVQLAGNGVALTDVPTPWIPSGPEPVGPEFERMPDKLKPLLPTPKSEPSPGPLKAPAVPIWPPPELENPTTPAELPPFTLSELKTLAETPAGENPLASPAVKPPIRKLVGQ